MVCVIHMKHSAVNQETSYESVTVHGQTLESLSNQLPTDVIALNELIKNAYDADATEVSINYDSMTDVLTIVDNGMGIPRDGVRKLFAVGKSEKQYGKSFCSQEKGETRYIQGSKGLGFLAVLRFAEDVEWDTCTEKEAFKFRCRGSEMLQMDNVTDYKVSVVPSRKKKRGTTITMGLRPDSRESLDELFADPAKIAKLVNAFRATNIKIKLVKDGSDIPTKKIDSFYNECERRRLFYVAISSRDNIATIYHNGDEIDNVCFVNQLPDKCWIEGELLIFGLQTGDSKEISPLYKKSSDGATLSPLVYINHSLFDNETLFNPEILRKQQSKKALPQMIGYVDVISESQDLKFNPDRTKLVENAYSKAIQNTLYFINKEVQILGAKYKAENRNDLKFGNPKPSSTRQKIVGRVVVPRNLSAYTGSGDIDLKRYVLKVYNNEGNIESVDDLKIYANDTLLVNGILPQQGDEGDIPVKYELDLEGVKVASEAILKVRNKRIKETGLDFFPYKFSPVKNTYMKLCAHAINRIEELYSKKVCNERRYVFVVACALRSLFELSAKSLRAMPHVPQELNKEMKVKDAIPAIFAYLHDSQNRGFLTSMSKNFRLDYDSLNNLSMETYLDAYTHSHLGAHQGNLLYSKSDIEDIAKKASLFAYLVNKMHKVFLGEQ